MAALPGVVHQYVHGKEVVELNAEAAFSTENHL
jgi:hypothetical protein